MADSLGHTPYAVGQKTELDAPYAAIEPVPDGIYAYGSSVPRKPYRSPREWLPARQQGLFGGPNPESLDWHTPETDLEVALLAAAKAQSNLAFGIRASGYYIPTANTAAQVDLHPDTVRDVLNGSKHASLAVLYALTDAVGRDLTVMSQHRPPQPAESDPHA